MAQWLRTCVAALLEALSSIPTPMPDASQLPVRSAAEEVMLISGLCRHTHVANGCVSVCARMNNVFLKGKKEKELKVTNLGDFYQHF